MISVNGLSQNIKQDSITLHIKTFDNMLYADQVCDSIKVAFKNKSKLLDTLVADNHKLFFKLEQSQEERLKLNSQITSLNKTLKHKRNNSLLYVLSGFGLGTLTTILLLQ